VSAASSIFGLAILAYGLSAALYIQALWAKKDTRFRGAAAFSLYVAIGLHLLYLIARTLQAGHLPLSTARETLYVVAWVIVAMYVAVERMWRIAGLGAFAVPLGLIALALTIFAPTGAGKAADWKVLTSPLLGAHILLVLAGYAAFSLGFCAAAMYIFQDWLLKSKRLRGVSRHLPPLQAADETAYRLIMVGFPVFTVGVVLGMVGAHFSWGHIFDWREPKETLSIVTWLLYAAYIHARAIAGWKGRRTALLLSACFLVSMVTYLGAGWLGGHRHIFAA
jgi:cytochrome c-type biogenesis protein CcsB